MNAASVVGKTFALRRPFPEPKLYRENPKMKQLFLTASSLFVALAALGGATAVSAADATTAHAFLADRHAARNVPCSGCHKGTPNADVDMQQCLACHGGSYAALAKKTESDDINPHDTHLGEAQCVTCHQGHKEPRLSCDGCHEFTDIRVP